MARPSRPYPRISSTSSRDRTTRTATPGCTRPRFSKRSSGPSSARKGAALEALFILVSGELLTRQEVQPAGRARWLIEGISFEGQLLRTGRTIAPVLPVRSEEPARPKKSRTGTHPHPSCLTAEQLESPNRWRFSTPATLFQNSTTGRREQAAAAAARELRCSTTRCFTSIYCSISRRSRSIVIREHVSLPIGGGSGLENFPPSSFIPQLFPKCTQKMLPST